MIDEYKINKILFLFLCKYAFTFIWHLEKLYRFSPHWLILNCLRGWRTTDKFPNIKRNVLDGVTKKTKATVNDRNCENANQMGGSNQTRFARLELVSDV